MSLSGKVAVVTGANAGIGLETARELAARGARVILACRCKEKAEAAYADIVATTNNHDVVIQTLNLASLQSVCQFADDFNRNEKRLDILVNNAGAFTAERRVTDDGLEMDFGVNHIGHFLLTNLLLDKLKASAPSRIITVSSKSHEYSNIDLNDINSSRHWSALKAYGRSKTANILFTVYLAKLLQDTGVTTYCLHPGVVSTGLGREFEGSWQMKCFRCFWKCFKGGMDTPSEGAQTTVYCCVDPKLASQSGLYYSHCKQARAKSYAADLKTAEALWKLSWQICAPHLQPATVAKSARIKEQD